MSVAPRFAHTEVLTLDGPVEQVFPLFGPVLEKQWAHGWDPVIIYSDPPLADHAGAIFTSTQPGEPDTIWYVNRFDAGQHVIQYLRITPGRHFVVLDITCEALEDARTRASVTYQFTALSEDAGAAFDTLKQPHPTMVQHWQEAINQILRSHKAD